MQSSKLFTPRKLTKLYSKHKISNNRYFSSVSEETRRQNDMFTAEKQRQRELIGRIEKIEVQCDGTPDNPTLVMNKNISTPYDCAKHLGEMLTNRSAVALINGETLWHMHKPIPESCKLEFLHYNMPQPAAVNKAFWRTCSFLLGAVINSSFKENVDVQLHSFPIPNVRSGSFIYDTQLSLPTWCATSTDLRTLSLSLIHFCAQRHPLHTLDVSAPFALDLFRRNRHKVSQIPDIAAHNGGRVTLYKAGQHVDISKGPLVTGTEHVGRVTVTGVHRLEGTGVEMGGAGGGGGMYRVQGVALPRVMMVNHFAYGVLEERARKMNPARIPTPNEITTEDNTFVSNINA